MFSKIIMITSQIILTVSVLFLLLSIGRAKSDVLDFVNDDFGKKPDNPRPIVMQFFEEYKKLKQSVVGWLAMVGKQIGPVIGSLDNDALSKDQQKDIEELVTQAKVKDVKHQIKYIYKEDYFGHRVDLSKWINLFYVTFFILLENILSIAILVLYPKHSSWLVLINVVLVIGIMIISSSLSFNLQPDFQDAVDLNKVVLDKDNWPTDLKHAYSHILFENPKIQDVPINLNNQIQSRMSLLAVLLTMETKYQSVDQSRHDLMTLLRMELGGDLLGSSQVLNELWTESKLSYLQLDSNLRSQVDTVVSDLRMALNNVIAQYSVVILSAKDENYRKTLIGGDKSQMDLQGLNEYYERRLQQENKLKDLTRDDNPDATSNDK